ncbi:MAG: hypothetical protein KatS3mg105_0745 [Gemmatales bacterium]|nr:MAG: hypothetical protein KatS3mg105_0745 [Gemmatales bacterium]
MKIELAYLGRSRIVPRSAGWDLSLAPNLRRDRVSFAARLQKPIPFREAISALHDIVISDLRYKPRDRTAYRAYLAEQKEREAEIRHAAMQAVRQERKEQAAEIMPPGLEDRYRRMRSLYWKARQKYANYLARHDPKLWRLLMPCDPIITVAPDVLFFECFSADESSYGCLTADRDLFQQENNVALGTTNVDYSWTLYEHFQKLRSYRETRFQIDPAGFEVKTEEAADYREEKIDLPPSWLRGFLQIQSAMSLPMRRVPLNREGLYALLAFLKRHRARKSPRALRFEIDPGQSVQVVLEPWEKRLVLYGTKYEGERSESIRIWGRNRLLVLARLLPILEGAEVYLLGTGLPSFWIMHLGGMRLTLGLSGWTANDWTGGAALDQIAVPAEPSEDVLADIAETFKSSPALTFAQIQQRTGAAPLFVAAGLNKLALLGQLIHDLPAGLYRWRQVLPVALSEKQIGPENPETAEGRNLLIRGEVEVEQDETTPKGLRMLAGGVEHFEVHLFLDADGRILHGKCGCRHHYRFGLRRGPCRHLQALRNSVLAHFRHSSLENWFKHYWQIK